MSNCYCMQCGGVNLAGANFCCKCGNPFGAVASAPAKTRPTSQDPPPIKKKKYNPPYKPAVVPLQEAMKDKGEMIAAIDDEDDEIGGISLDYVPEVEGLEFDEIISDVIPKVSLDQLLAEKKQK